MNQKSYKFRIYPTQEQQEQIKIDLDVSRWVWNFALGLKQNKYRKSYRARPNHTPTDRVRYFR